MDRDEQNVAAIVENILRAIAMVVIDIEDRNALPARRDGRFGRHRDIVDEAIAAQIIRAAMVSRRAAQREG